MLINAAFIYGIIFLSLLLSLWSDEQHLCINLKQVSKQASTPDANSDLRTSQFLHTAK